MKINTTQKVERYLADVKEKYKYLNQLDRMEDIFAMLFGLVVMPNSNKEFI